MTKPVGIDWNHVRDAMGLVHNDPEARAMDPVEVEEAILKALREYHRQMSSRGDKSEDLG